MRKLMWFTMGYALSCALGTYLLRGRGLLLIFAACALGALTLVKFREHPVFRRGMVLLLGCAVGALAFFGYEYAVLRPAGMVDGETVPVTIQATGYSWPTQYGTGCDGELELDGRTYKVRFYRNETEVLEPGDVVTMSAQLRLTDEGGDREPTFHRTSGILLLAYPRGDSVAADGEPELRDLPAIWANRLKGIIGESFPADAFAFAKALLLGDKSGLSWQQSREFSLSGISHIVAVSGLHVSILFGFLGMVMGRRRWLMLLAGVPVLLCFGAMAGFTASVTRAVLMQILFLLALAVNREYDPPTALSFAGLVILLQCPLSIAGIGFQLSFASVAGIFLFYPKLSGWLKTWLPGKGKKLRGRLERWFVSSVCVTLSATVMTVPLVAVHFGVVSLVGVVTNLLVLPVVSLIFYGVMAVCALGCLHSGAAAVLAEVISVPIRYVLAVAKTMAGIPLSAVFTVSPYIELWLVFTYGLILLLLIARNKRPGVTFVLSAAALCVSLMLSFLEPLTCDYRVTVLDVGQGQCIVLQSEGNTFLVDCGGDRGEKAADIAAEYLLSQGIRRIDGLILTHYDRDHAEGAQYLPHWVEIERVYLPETEDADGCRTACWSCAGERIVIDGDIQIAFGDAQIRIFPAKDAGSGNDSCASVLFQREKCDTLITGDLSAKAERQLLADYDLPDLEVLIVGHHGSKYSTCAELLNATAPDAAIISVGKDNGYGHPTIEVLDRLKQAGCAVYRTDLHGTITYRG